MCHLWTFLCCHVDNVLKAHFSYLSTHRSSWAVAGLWLGCGWQILFQGKKRCHLATWTRPATCGRTWDTLLIITWEGMDRNRKQIDINISAMIHTYIKLIIKGWVATTVMMQRLPLVLVLVLVPTCQHVRLFSAIQPESAVILNPSSVFVSSMFVTRRTR